MNTGTLRGEIGECIIKRDRPAKGSLNPLSVFVIDQVANDDAAPWSIWCLDGGGRVRTGPDTSCSLSYWRSAGRR
jgi:hypothetical protein